MLTRILLMCLTFGSIHQLVSCMITNGYKDHSDFISKIPDTKLVRNLALIGTFHSAAFKPMKYVRTQNLTISEQLQAGIRVLDIHLSVDFDKLKVYYNLEYLNCTFDDVLTEVQSFMTLNPKELVIILLSVNLNFFLTDSISCEVLDSYVGRWQKRGLKLVQDWSLLEDYVGEHRGHVLLGHVRESNFKSCSVYLPCEVQDNWNVTDAEKKWKFVKDSQDGMLFAYHPYHSCYINYLASYNPLIMNYWQPDSDDGADELKLGMMRIEDVNERMAGYFRNPYDTLDMVVTEFPSQKLIDKVIGSNFQ
uniref:Hypothetical phosphatidylinositol-specific phospholipase PIPLC n=1 Tax=Cotesia congregata TaxID=51543 RepID=S6D9N3_COTCN|nr:hypothetical phosphatidylinositol-specific phospholipase PIPLC [Cotesia congregata]